MTSVFPDPVEDEGPTDTWGRPIEIPAEKQKELIETAKEVYSKQRGVTPSEVKRMRFRVSSEDEEGWWVDISTPDPILPGGTSCVLIFKNGDPPKYYPGM